MGSINLILLAVNLISIIGMIIVASIVIAGGITKTKFFFSAMIYLASIWLLIQNIVQVYSLGGEIGLRLIQLTSALAIMMAICFYFFSVSYTNKIIPTSSYLFGVVISILSIILNFSGLMIQNARGTLESLIIDEATNFYLVYIAMVGVIFISSFIRIIKNTIYAKTKFGKARNKLLIIGVSQAVFVLAVVSIFFQSSFIEIQAIIPLSLLIMAIIVSYAIFKRGLFDVRTTVVRTTTYMLSLLVLSAIYYVIAYTLSLFIFKDNVSSALSISPVNIAIALVLAFVFQPIKRFFDRVTNKFFFKNSYNSDEFFATINDTLGSAIDLRNMLEKISNEIAKTLKGEQVFFFVNIDKNHFITAGTHGHGHLPKNDTKIFEAETDQKEGVIVASILGDNNETSRMMLSHRLELVMPLKKDNMILGYLCLGEHLTSRYKERDIKVLNGISNALIIAIQNALAVHEIREFNETLKQRIANATEELRASNRMLRQLDKAKDEFVGMASHQLRTPLTSVKGYISMVMDGDAGKINKSQEQLLAEAFNSSERMVNLINDFLNVSRIQTGKFVIEKTEFDLSKLVTEEISNLEPSIEAHKLKFIFKKPNAPLVIDADESKIRQVVMNFMDNAVYYSPDSTTVEVDVFAENNEAIFRVKDSGIGVPISERSQLFTKFYRASNARRKRPDGTGVGLYLAKKVIDAHSGKIIFESTEGKGSTFGFRLPMDQNS